jgi:Domain of unknown function (DUF5655)
MTKPSPRKSPLWRCPKCGRRFAKRNQTHFCGRHGLERHFEGKTPGVRELFEAILALLRSFGPVTVLPEKTRIAFQVRMSFAAVSVRKTYLVGHFIFGRRVEHPRFLRVETYSPRNHLHAFRIASLADLDEEFAEWGREAYAVGQQRHLDSGSDLT